jgi:hypothetical protein
VNVAVGATGSSSGSAATANEQCHRGARSHVVWMRERAQVGHGYKAVYLRDDVDTAFVCGSSQETGQGSEACVCEASHSAAVKCSIEPERRICTQLGTDRRCGIGITTCTCMRECVRTWGECCLLLVLFYLPGMRSVGRSAQIAPSCIEQCV